MDSVSSETIIQKYETLPGYAKREVADFIDFLVSRRKKPVKKKDKKKLLEVSCWSDEDIEAIEDAGKEINKWKPEAF
ncbi:MAG: DUF2281 domain-containing protein [Candidatus Aminicenantes bacterium]|nr:DUF2281 domain-containing protein [Candidatus Aminicenantes bacterium]